MGLCVEENKRNQLLIRKYKVISRVLPTLPDLENNVRLEISLKRSRINY